MKQTSAIMTQPLTFDIDPSDEPRKVKVIRGEWRDETRENRGVPYKIYYPEATPEEGQNGSHDPFPVIIWSHGLGGTQDGAGFISRFLTSHGFIHVNIGHEGTNDSLWRGKPGHPWDNIRKAHIPWEDVKNRYLDAPFALDQLAAMDLPVPADFNRVGMSGHSFGAGTTQILAGQLTGNPDPEDLSDHRFKAALAYSPVPNARLDLPPEQIYGGIKIPMLHLTGSEDHSPITGPIQDQRDLIFNHAGQNGAMQMSVILDGADHMVFNGSRGQLPDYEGMAAHQEQIKMIALAWFNATLKEDQAAQGWLVNDLQAYIGSDSVIRVKNRLF